MRRYFGTDGVRGIVGEDLTMQLVERLGKAATLWSKGGRVFVGRDTRGSGPELEEAFARGVVEAGGNAVLAGVLPTPAVALLALDLGVVVSASHNPPEYNGIKIFDRDGRKLTDAAEEEIEALLEAEGPGGGKVDRVDVATDSYLEHIVERFGSDLSPPGRRRLRQRRLLGDRADGVRAAGRGGDRGRGGARRDEHQSRVRRH
jgi:phosphoglucosamine mutase